MEKSWRATVFILNLAVADFLYSSVHLPLYAIQYFYGGWPWSNRVCYITTVWRIINAFADWIFLGVIAVSRCLMVIQHDLWLKMCSNNKYLLSIIGGTWLYAFFIVIPIVCGVSSHCLSIKLSIMPINMYLLQAVWNTWL